MRDLSRGKYEICLNFCGDEKISENFSKKILNIAAKRKGLLTQS